MTLVNVAIRKKDEETKKKAHDDYVNFIQLHPEFHQKSLEDLNRELEELNRQYNFHYNEKENNRGKYYLNALPWSIAITGLMLSSIVLSTGVATAGIGLAICIPATIIGFVIATRAIKRMNTHLEEMNRYSRLISTTQEAIQKIETLSAFTDTLPQITLPPPAPQAFIKPVKNAEPDWLSKASNYIGSFFNSSAPRSETDTLMADKRVTPGYV